MKILEILGSLAPLARPRAASLRPAPLQASPARCAGNRQAGLRTRPPAGTPDVPRSCEVPRNYEDFTWISIGFSHDVLGFL